MVWMVRKYLNLVFCVGIIFFNRVDKNNIYLFLKWLDLIIRLVTIIQKYEMSYLK